MLEGKSCTVPPTGWYDHERCLWLLLRQQSGFRVQGFGSSGTLSGQAQFGAARSSPDTTFQAACAAAT
jgi:hypothetical protein